MDKKLSSINDQLFKKSLKYLEKFQKQDAKLVEELKKFNLNVTIAKVDEKYNALTEKIKSKGGFLNKVTGGYNAYLDMNRYMQLIRLK